MELSPARRVCYEQMKALVDFMGQHVEFAKGEMRGNVARHKSKTLWAELTKTVNGIGGTKKTPDMWSRVGLVSNIFNLYTSLSKIILN